ncbi:MAG: hypothetical protein PHZ02_14150 [Desulfocapsaceae bacterium]|nr:hypothetical protein [Desulfocapsaceae bacterium]
MIRVIIGDSERELSNISEHWINEQINRRKRDGLSICVRVIINEDQLNLSLTTSGCPHTATGGRAPNKYESEVFDLWNKRGLNKENFSEGNLIAFLKQLKV